MVTRSATASALVAACVLASACGGRQDTPKPPPARGTTVTGERAETSASPRCPRTRGSHAVPEVAVVIGDGPVYVALGMAAAPPAASGVVDVSDDARHDGLYHHKTLLAVLPGDPATFRLTGRERGGQRRRLVFFDGHHRHDVLGLRRGSAWTYSTTTILLPGPGCYLIDARGAGARQRLTFQVVDWATPAGVLNRRGRP